MLLLSAAVMAAASPSLDQSTVVITAERQASPVRDTPGGADLVPAAAFEDRVAVSLKDALAFSPGVYAQPRFGQEVRLSIRGSGIGRGFHMRGLTLLQDGIPINLADNNGDFQELDPQVFDRIEVYRGSNALRFGSSTLGGGINAVTPTGRSDPGLQLRLDGGSFGTVRGKTAWGHSDAAGDAGAALTFDRGRGDRDHARRRAMRFNGNAGLKLGPQVETRFYGSVNHIRQELPGALTRTLALTAPQTSLPGNISGDQARDIDSLRLQNRTTIDLGASMLTLGGYWNAKQLYHPIFQVVDQNSDDRGLFARGEAALGPVSIAGGVLARFLDMDARQFVNVGGLRGALTAEAQQSARTIDTYGEARLAISADLSLIAGAVWTHGRRASDNRLAPARSGSASYDAFSPKFGLLWERNGVQLYANYSRSVELPGLSELAQAQAQPGFVDLSPQRAWTAEAGTRGNLGSLAWDVTFYRSDLRGELLQFTVGPDIPAATFNAARTRHQGIEAALDWSPLAWLRLRQAWQLNDFRFRGDRQFGDNRLPVIARQLYRAELRLGSERASVSPQLEWVPRGAWADYANSVRAPGYKLLNLGARAELARGATLFLDARNLAGRKAIGDVSAVVKADAASAIYYPVERRSLFVGARMDL